MRTMKGDWRRRLGLPAAGRRPPSSGFTRLHVTVAASEQARSVDGTDSCRCVWFGALPLNGCPSRRARCACRHKQERKFPCPFCGKRFAFKDGLERHFLVHPPYECPMCARVFSTAAELQVWKLVGEDAQVVAVSGTGRRRGGMGR